MGHLCYFGLCHRVLDRPWYHQHVIPGMFRFFLPTEYLCIRLFITRYVCVSSFLIVSFCYFLILFCNLSRFLFIFWPWCPEFLLSQCQYDVNSQGKQAKLMCCEHRVIHPFSLLCLIFLIFLFLSINKYLSHLKLCDRHFLSRRQVLEQKFKNIEDEIAQSIAVFPKLQSFVYRLCDFCHICILSVICLTCFCPN